ncbi:hypothetical protein AZH11_12695 [Pseudomonas simiae]|nr:hypothetical protein AZH11_12695 [Pseudomonas simiae]
MNIVNNFTIHLTMVKLYQVKCSVGGEPTRANTIVLAGFFGAVHLHTALFRWLPMNSRRYSFQRRRF